MRLTKSTVTLLVGLALVFALPSQAQEAGQEACAKAYGIPNLTPEQAAKIETLKIEHQKALLLLQTDLKTKRLELRQLMNEKADQKTLEAKIDELAKIGANIQKKCLAQRNEVRGLLTDEQKKSFDQKCSGMGCGVVMGHRDGCGGRDAHRMGNMRRCGHVPGGAEPERGCSKRCRP